MSEF
jgi:hypothetical protein